MKSLADLQDEVLTLGEGYVEAAQPLGTVLNSAETRKLAERVLEDLTKVSAEWLGNAVPIAEGLIHKAQDEGLSDADFIAAVEAATVAMPSLFGKLKWQTLATALEKAQGAAMVNGIASRLREFQAAP